MKLRTSTPRAAAVVVGLALVATLSACSANGDSAKPTPTPTAAGTPKAAAAMSCGGDGRAVLEQDDANVRLDGSCSTLEIRASHVQVVAGRDLDDVTVSGKLNYIRVNAVGKVTLGADSEGNRIVTTSTPQVDDQGRTNVVAPAPEGH